MATQQEMVQWAKNNINKWIDVDGAYGAQCVDLIMAYARDFGGMVTRGNAIDYMKNTIPKYWTRYKKGQTQIQPGDVAIWSWGAWDIYGHVGIVTAVNGRSITSVEQNVDGAAVGVGGYARVRTRNDDCLVGFIRPNYTITQDTNNRNWTRVPEIGKFTLAVDEINIRETPNRNSKVVGTYKKGQSVIYDSYCIADGFVWISWIGGSGNRRFMAIGAHDGNRRISVWGNFSIV